MVNQQTATLGLQLLAQPDQLLALSRNMSRLFLRFARHPNHRQFPGIAFHVTRQTLTQRSGIARIGLYPGKLLVEFARRDHIAVRTSGT